MYSYSSFLHNYLAGVFQRVDGYIVEYLEVKRKTTTLINFEGIALSEKRQTPSFTYSMIILHDILAMTNLLKQRT